MYWQLWKRNPLFRKYNWFGCPATQPEVSALSLATPATGHEPESPPSTSHLQHMCCALPSASWSTNLLHSKGVPIPRGHVLSASTNLIISPGNNRMLREFDGEIIPLVLYQSQSSSLCTKLTYRHTSNRKKTYTIKFVLNVNCGSHRMYLDQNQVRVTAFSADIIARSTVQSQMWSVSYVNGWNRETDTGNGWTHPQSNMMSEARGTFICSQHLADTRTYITGGCLFALMFLQNMKSGKGAQRNELTVEMAHVPPSMTIRWETEEWMWQRN